MTRGKYISKTHGQRRPIKLTRGIYRFIDHETRQDNFISGQNIQYQIMDIFKVNLSLTRMVANFLQYNHIRWVKYFKNL